MDPVLILSLIISSAVSVILNYYFSGIPQLYYPLLVLAGILPVLIVRFLLK